METDFRELEIEGLDVKEYKDKLVVEDKLTLRFEKENDKVDAHLTLFFLATQIEWNTKWDARRFVRSWANSHPSMRGSEFRSCIQAGPDGDHPFWRSLKTQRKCRTGGW